MDGRWEEEACVPLAGGARWVGPGSGGFSVRAHARARASGGGELGVAVGSTLGGGGGREPSPPRPPHRAEHFVKLVTFACVPHGTFSTLHPSPSGSSTRRPSGRSPAAPTPPLPPAQQRVQGSTAVRGPCWVALQAGRVTRTQAPGTCLPPTPGHTSRSAPPTYSGDDFIVVYFLF